MDRRISSGRSDGSIGVGAGYERGGGGSKGGKLDGESRACSEGRARALAGGSVSCWQWPRSSWVLMREGEGETEPERRWDGETVGWRAADCGDVARSKLNVGEMERWWVK